MTSSSNWWLAVTRRIAMLHARQLQVRTVRCLPEVRQLGCRNGKLLQVAAMADAEAWRANLIRDPASVQQIALQAKRVAVLGIKTEQQATQPAFFVPQYLQSAGVDVVPVPVFYPEVTHILGQQVYRRVQDVPGELDILDVFRKPSDVIPHVDDILAKSPLPKVVWLQSGITNPEAEEVLARAGIRVVSDRCLKVDHQQAMMQSKM